jgi:alpha-beta hydrolase superfamily lysophospholipase
MYRLFRAQLLAALVAVAPSILPAVPAYALEQTIPSKMGESLKPEISAKYTYTEDGVFTTDLKLPTYEWMPAGRPPQAIVLGIHGLTLHGRRYRVLARTAALHGYGFVSLDMRGFGRCRFDDLKQFSEAGDDKRKINHEKSYADIVRLAQLIKARYPDLPMLVLGESLGCTFCVRLAAEHPELVSGMILSAPAVKVNPAMYARPSDIKQGVKAIVSPHHMVDLHSFITQLVSPRPDVVQEMLDDPLILKKISLLDLIATDEFVTKISKWAMSVEPGLPVLILQGGGDKCVVPKDVTALMYAIPSTDQTLRWLGRFGHLQLETSYIRAVVVDTIGDWIKDHSTEEKAKMQALEQDIENTGGVLVR